MESIDLEQTLADPKGHSPSKSKKESPSKKVIVAVHGIGDQFNFATIQTVAYRFFRFFGSPAGVPLGSFHASRVGSTGAFLFQGKEYPEEFCRIGFDEVYWASIPREPEKEGHTIEEAKKWATTIVERLNSRNETGRSGLNNKDYEKVRSVLDEMINTLAVLERLCLIAKKAGVFEFDLKTILTAYLGDVQIVTEFADYREKILAQFYAVMKKVSNDCDEIHIVAHSEGTVVAFLGLLTAMCKYHDARAEWSWIEKVRGLLTIGSPIDKHVILWPELWKQFERETCSKPFLPNPPIEWRNFYDFGDPIGFEVESGREWMETKTSHLNTAFNFDPEKHDRGFYRYPFPGKAHNDYWDDEELFGHFIRTVVDEKPKPTGKKPPNYAEPPGNRFWPPSRLIVKTVPYLLVGLLLFVAVYVLYKATGTAFNREEGSSVIFRHVAGLASLLGGVTLMARIPRLTNLKFGVPVGTLAFASLTAIYYFLIPHHEPDNRFSNFAGLIFNWAGVVLPFNLDSLIGLAIVVVLLVYSLNHIVPKWGLKTLLIPGFVVVIGMIVYGSTGSATTQAHGPLWPLLLALAAFLYLWWLAALIFDLVFVWHLFIQNSQAMENLRDMTGKRTVRERRRRKATARVPAT